MIQTLSDALAARGYETLTPVQEAVTDPELAQSDLLVSAQTGSGKTVGFGLAIGPTLLDEAGRLGRAAAPLALIVAPTRELAFQVTRELEWLYAGAGARVASCVGGMDARDERRALERGAHIVVGTPGRLRDHITRGSLEMGDLRAVVLDEADEMLDLGFREDLEFMLDAAPETRRTLLFSATVPPMIAKLAQQFQRDAVRVSTVSERSQHADITYQALRVAQQDAENAIINVLRYHEAQNAIVFANTRAAVNRLTARFANRGFSVVCLSGELSQQERTHALQAMRDGRARVCVATDVAARGIDLPNLELVIHAELPSNPEGLLHRSGRTGRAGRKGISALIVPPKVTKRAERLLKFAKIQAEWTTAPNADEILRRDEERLLSDPVWSEEITEAEADFAARLVDLHKPDVIAAAYLRLFRARHSAPEELADPDTRAPVRERAPFGPARWISLSVGHDDRAEARWLLPLLCRAGGLEKDSIGAIRVRQSETFVELTEASLPGFLSALGGGGELEDGVTATALDSAPDLGPAGPRGRGGPGGKPGGKPQGPRPGRVPRADLDPDAPAEDRPAPRAKPAPRPAGEGAKPVWKDKPRPAVREDDDRRGTKPVWKKGGDDRKGAKPAWKKDGDDRKGAKPAWKRDGDDRKGAKPAWKKDGDDRKGGKPAWKKDGDDRKGGKPAWKKDGDDRKGGKPGGKFAGKPGGKPGGKPRADATDTSKRFKAPTKRAGGAEPPKRKPRS
ncbi:DEAD/DEAH box helicase [Pseudooceanicola aestuarii]|uniref:DEAD/DEAH box helicase n=1 Tax=Pseudooceanicola aestuarii TaxID=2697319 RepID=UPI0013D78FFA|nr:DEAD/DEAH box helicase [Pseudooceanicola aestuarii]